MTMPSERDRRLLDEIEAVLRTSDPRLDQALRTFRLRRRWPLVWATAGFLAGAAGAGAAFAGWFA